MKKYAAVVASLALLNKKIEKEKKSLAYIICYVICYISMDYFELVCEQ